GSGFFQNNVNIHEINLANNMVDSKGCEYLADMLKENNDSLEVLDIAWNHVRTRGAVEIGQAIGVNTSLVKLDLAWNGFGVEGCEQLSKSLVGNCSLMELNLTCNRLNDEALKMILNALKENSVLQKLKV
ncbi:hypothetical protein CAPTEDRAFT_37241, partial [Capitella teleta]